MQNHGNNAMKERISCWSDWLREYGPRLLLFARQQARRAEDGRT